MGIASLILVPLTPHIAVCLMGSSLGFNFLVFYKLVYVLVNQNFNELQSSSKLVGKYHILYKLNIRKLYIFIVFYLVLFLCISLHGVKSFKSLE